MPRYIEAEQLKHIINEKKYNARNKQFFFDCIAECNTSDVAPVVHAHWIMPRNDDGMSDPIYYQVRCSKCGFGLDAQTWVQELQQYGADKYCPKCGAKMDEEE